MAGETVPVDTVAKIFNVTTRRVQQLVTEGKIPKPIRGQYNLLLCIRTYIGFLQDSLKGQDTAPDSLKKHRARLTAARADVAELERDAMAAKQVPIEQVDATWATAVGTMRSRLLTIPSKVAARIHAAKTTNDAQEIVRREIFDVLEELSKVSVASDQPADQDGSGGDGDEHVPDDGAATGSNGKRVGRSRKGAVR